MIVLKCENNMCDDQYGGPCFAISQDESERDIRRDLPCFHNDKGVPQWKKIDASVMCISTDFYINEKTKEENKIIPKVPTERMSTFRRLAHYIALRLKDDTKIYDTRFLHQASPEDYEYYNDNEDEIVNYYNTLSTDEFISLSQWGTL